MRKPVRGCELGRDAKAGSLASGRSHFGINQRACRPQHPGAVSREYVLSLVEQSPRVQRSSHQAGEGRWPAAGSPLTHNPMPERQLCPHTFILRPSIGYLDGESLDWRTGARPPNSRTDNFR